jgi:hypothetical protein
MREDRNFKASDVSGPSIWIFILWFRPYGPHQCSADEQDESNCYLQLPLMPHDCGTSKHARALKLQAVSVRNA